MSENSSKSLVEQKQLYAELIVKIGLNLQEGQSLRIAAEPSHAPFARVVVAEAYKAGARYVQLEYLDTPATKARLQHSNADYIDYVPEYEVIRHQQMKEEQWARLSFAGDEFPGLLEDTDPALMRSMNTAKRQALRFYFQALMANQMQWCVAAVPTAAWAKKVFPDLDAEAGIERLWELILQTCRIDRPDPIAAWREHGDQLRRVIAYMAEKKIRTVRYFDPTPADDGKPSTDLTVGLTDNPVWIGASSHRPDGVEFLPNMPTEEVFTTPHKDRTEGWVRTAKPTFPMDREVDGAYMRFEGGEVVEFRAEKGQETLEEFFKISGARQLGEASLVDVRSPINQSGLLFHDILFDENAVCHIAFGEAYPEGTEGGNDMSEEELAAAGVNQSDTHVDFMIGTPTMQLIGTCADGSEVLIMDNGQFTPEVLRA